MYAREEINGLKEASFSAFLGQEQKKDKKNRVLSK